MNKKIELKHIENHIEEKIQLITLNEWASNVRINLIQKKLQGVDLIAGGILKELRRERIVILNYLFNKVFRLKYVQTKEKFHEY